MSNSQKPVSEKQFAANRANAAHSTGPRTPEGKARSAQNSRQYGFTASHFAVIRLEDLQEVARLRVDHRPVNSQELFAIERIALAQQAMLRIAHLGRRLARRRKSDTIPLVGEQKLADAVRAVARLPRAKALALGGALMGGEIETAVREVRQAGSLVISLNMAGSVPETADLVVNDPVQAGVMAAMAVAETAKSILERLKRRAF